jgi:hypothetical protein
MELCGVISVKEGGKPTRTREKNAADWLNFT